FRAGDIITRVGKAEISSGEELKAASARFDEKPVTVQVLRGDERVQLSVAPAKLKTGEFSLGLWVRDGISGIGTVTFYDPETGMFGALGHAVADADTGVVLPVREGSITKASVTDVQRGESGAPGQLHGAFDFDETLGEITENTEHGIFGTFTRSALKSNSALFSGDALEVADEREIHTGAAYILANVSGSEIQRFEVEISRVYSGSEAAGRTMLVTMKDDALTSVTGGIVQGMSGSPIVQDGKLVGAVTHVLVSDPAKGYAISIEKMLEQECAAKQLRKAA
ncbi:MAG: SpoIVB peptidase, partial [Oscillospiraceae bacterium]|nr:SpoIVB peptidase [Oscillospiraceae bacterium]